MPGRPASRKPVNEAERVATIIARLRARYPEVRLPLHHGNPLQLLIATILSAQCTDAMVNKVTPALFARWRTAADFGGADPRELEEMIHPTGFFRQKARAIMGACRTLVEHFHGAVPDTMDDLRRLEGVGRKTANVLLSAARLEKWPGWRGAGAGPEADGLGLVVDTHVRRLAQRLGLSRQDDPEKIEQDLMRIIPIDEWDGFSLRLIYFGREICKAQRPVCPVCPLNDACPSAPHGGTPPWQRRRALARAGAGRDLRGQVAARVRRGGTPRRDPKTEGPVRGGTRGTRTPASAAPPSGGTGRRAPAQPAAATRTSGRKAASRGSPARKRP
ncbi:MAG: endonuclease III [Armatimonadetes bacterium]|nr:endonuclease III [Armatimonadota bacterium]